MPSWKAAANLVRKIAENYKLPYYTMSPTYSVCSNHGYLAGEIYECPHCKQETEVYSRITGYYRPVKNWNDGKSQEFQDRQVYEVGQSNFIKGDARVAEVAAGYRFASPLSEAIAIKDEAEGKSMMGKSVPESSSLPLGVYLVSTKTCPNCRRAEQLLGQAGVTYEKVFAEDNRELAERYSIMQAPSLLVVEQEGAARVVRGAAEVFKEIPVL